MSVPSSSIQSSGLKACIQRVEINGFRSLRKVGLDLPKLAVMIGSNGAGKSNLIRFFEMVSWMLRGQNLANFVTKHGGGDDQLFMGAKVTARMDGMIRIDSGVGFNDYRFGLVHVTARDQLMFVDEAFRYSKHEKGTENQWVELDGVGTEAQIVEAAQGRKVSYGESKTASSVVHLLRSCITYQFHDTSDNAPLKRPWDISDHAFLLSHGGNLPAILLRLRETDVIRYKLISKQISRVLPHFGGFDLQEVGYKVQLRWHFEQQEKTFGAHLTSDGSLRLFALITLLNLPPVMLPDVLFLDEPELGLHPHAIQLVASMLQRVSQTHQVIIATQSSAMVDCFQLDNIVVVKTEDGETSLSNLDPECYREWLDDEYSVSDLWGMDVLRGDV